MRYCVTPLCFWTIQRHHCPLVNEPRKFWYLQLSCSSSFSPVHHALERLSLSLSLSSLLPTCFFHKEYGDFIFCSFHPLVIMRSPKPVVRRCLMLLLPIATRGPIINYLPWSLLLIILLHIQYNSLSLHHNKRPWSRLKLAHL